MQRCVVVGVSERYPNLDLFRGIAALMVVASHAYVLGGRTPSLSAEHAADLLVLPGALGVYLFFVMSGALISRPFLSALVSGDPLPGTASYAVRRVMRIYPLYLVAFVAVVAVTGRGGLGPKTTAAVAMLLHNLVPGSQSAVIGAAWTLSIEVLFYLSIPILAGLVRLFAGRRPLDPEMLARLCVGAGVVSLAWMGMGEMASATSGSLSLYLRVLIFGIWWAFVPGLLLVLERMAEQPGPILGLVRRIRTDRDMVRRCLVALAPFGIFGLFAQEEWGARTFLFTHDMTRLIWTLGFAVVVIHWADRSSPESRVPRVAYWTGALSYGIYLWHAAILYAVEETGLDRFVPLPHGGFGPYLVHLVSLLAVSVLLAWVSWRLVEEPGNRLGRAWSRRVEGRSRARVQLRPAP